LSCFEQSKNGMLLSGKTWNFQGISFSKKRKSESFYWILLILRGIFWNFSFKFKFCLFLKTLTLFLWSIFLNNAKYQQLISNKYYSIHIRAHLHTCFANFYKKKQVTVEDNTQQKKVSHYIVMKLFCNYLIDFTAPVVEQDTYSFVPVFY